MSIIQTTASVDVGCVVTYTETVLLFVVQLVLVFELFIPLVLFIILLLIRHKQPAYPMPDSTYHYQISPVGPHISTPADPVTWGHILLTG